MEGQVFMEFKETLRFLCRLMVNLTQPAFLCWQHVPEDKERRQCYIEVEGLLQNYKQAFADEALFASLTKKLGDLLQLVSKSRIIRNLSFMRF